MSDYMGEAAALYLAGEQKLQKKMFKKPDIDGAVESFERAANMFKMAKNYERAGEAYKRSGDLLMQNGKEAGALTYINNAINCFNLTNPALAAPLVELLIGIAAKSGRFVQAGKAAMQQAEKCEELENYTEALKQYERAVELFQSESNADSEMRNAQLKVCELLVKTKQFLPAAKLYEEIGTRCLKIKLLQYHVRGHYFHAFCCILCLDDLVALEDSKNKYQTLDPNLDGSAEGDFMTEVVAALQNKNLDEYLGAEQKYSQRANLRGNTLIKQLFWAAHEVLKYLDPEQAGYAAGAAGAVEGELAAAGDGDML